jgi:hypothetical protein
VPRRRLLPTVRVVLRTAVLALVAPPRARAVPGCAARVATRVAQVQAAFEAVAVTIAVATAISTFTASAVAASAVHASVVLSVPLFVELRAILRMSGAELTPGGQRERGAQGGIDGRQIQRFAPN